MEDKVKFSKNVILVDVAFLNQIVYHAKRVLGERMECEFPKIDLVAWLGYLSLDAGLRGSDNEIQVILVHDEATHELNCFEPIDLDGLNAMGCRTALGEFVFSCVTPARITSCEALYLDLMNLALDSADVKCLMLVPFHPLYGDRVEDGLRNFFEGKDEEQCSRAVYFVMEKPLTPVLARWDLIINSLAQAFGIKSDDL